MQKKTNEVDTARRQYAQARAKVKTLLRKAKRLFERSIALQAKTNPKAFWGHTRRYLKTKSGIAPLRADPKDKDSMKFRPRGSQHSSQLVLVFTRESIGEFIRTIQIHQRKIYNDATPLLS